MKWFCLEFTDKNHEKSVGKKNHEKSVGKNTAI